MPRPKGSKNKPRATGVHLYVPGTFYPSRFPELKDREESALWFVHKIVCSGHRHQHDPDWDGMVHISRRTMQQYIHPSKVSAVRKALIDARVVIVNESYQISGEGTAGYSQSYGLHLSYAGELRRVEVTSPRLAAAIKAHRIEVQNRPVQQEKLNATLAYLLSSLRTLHIDVDRVAQLVAKQDHRQKVVNRKIGKRGRRRMVQIAYPSPATINSAVANAIARGDHEFSVCSYGRLHTLVTRLSSALRSALSFDGDRLASIDIRNSQLVFVLILLMGRRLREAASAREVEGDGVTVLADGCSSCGQAAGHPVSVMTPLTSPVDLANTTPIPLRTTIYSQGAENQTAGGSRGGENRPVEKTGASPAMQGTQQPYPEGTAIRAPLQPDEIAFRKSVLGGTIYDELMAACSYTDRGLFKKRFFQDVLYGDNNEGYSRNSPVARVFRRRYPNVWQFILDAKQDGYAQLARDMQSAESRYMIGRVCGRLAVHHPDVRVVTIHDSILTAPKNMLLVSRIMAEEFDRYGVQPQFAIEYPTPMGHTTPNAMGVAA